MSADAWVLEDPTPCDTCGLKGCDHEAAATPTIDLTLGEIVDILQRYVVMGREQAVALALWVVHTHAFESAVVTPYIAINSAAKRSGKTTLLELLALLVRRPWLTGRVSAAVLVRKTDKERPTLLLDESDAMFGGEKEYAEALRGILNTGFKASGMTSLCVGQGANITYKDFSTFSPKAIAGIGKLPDTVMDRAIVITLKRRAKAETVRRFRERLVRQETEPLCFRLEAWASAHLSALRKRQPELPDALNDRAQDVWEPLLAIADHLGGEWPALARKAAVTLSGQVSPEDDDIGVQLLGDCWTVFADVGSPEVLPSKELVDHLVAIEDRPWSAWSTGRPITQAKVARLLGGFGIHSATIRVGPKTPKGYTRRAFEDAWERYLPPITRSEVQHRNNPNNDGPESPISKAQRMQACCGSESQVTPINTGLSCGVAVSGPDPGTETKERGVDDGHGELF